MDHAEINTLKAFDEKLLSNCVRGPPTWETVKNLYVYRKTSSDIQREMEKENDNLMIVGFHCMDTNSDRQVTGLKETNVLNCASFLRS